MTAIPLGPGGEFDRVRAIAAALGTVMGPVGDDTATIPDGEGSVVVSVDASVEGVHFRREWLSLEEIGWRATAGALSDLAAAGATPVGVVVAVVVPRETSEAALIELMRGIGAATGSVGAKLLGGDLTSGRQWAAAVTVIGRAVRPVSRSGALAGDGVWVTGALGGARSALQAWTTAMAPDPASRSVFAHPVPRIAAGKWLAAHGATAMIDLSDGLGGDASHLAAASGVRIDIELERLPLHPSVTAAARHIGEAPELFAATAGEDYELLVTLPPTFSSAADFTRDCGLALTRVGTVAVGADLCATLAGVVQSVHGFRHAV